MSTQDRIEIENLRRTYRTGPGGLTALDGVCLDVGPGTFLGVTGPSGSGKSTLLNLLGGLDRPTAGAIRVGGQELSRLSRRQLARYRGRRVGMVFQAFQLIGSYTAAENVALPLLLAGMPRGRRRRMALERLEQVGLADRTDHKPGELSGGEQQRVAIARALAGEPGILLADEPTGNLDTASGEQILGLLGDLNQRLGVTIVLVSHELALIERFCGRIVALRDGRIVSDGPAAGVAG
jgi:putative ABC transport system ATP-binding protein